MGDQSVGRRVRCDKNIRWGEKKTKKHRAWWAADLVLVPAGPSAPGGRRLTDPPCQKLCFSRISGRRVPDVSWREGAAGWRPAPTRLRSSHRVAAGGPSDGGVVPCGGREMRPLCCPVRQRTIAEAPPEIWPEPAADHGRETWVFARLERWRANPASCRETPIEGILATGSESAARVYRSDGLHCGRARAIDVHTHVRESRP